MGYDVTLSGFGNTVYLNSPVFGDVNSIEHIRISRQTRGGQRIVYRDSTWPKIERLKFKFENLNQSHIKNLLLFMEKWTGRQITLTDQNGQNWLGIITNPIPDAIQETSDEIGCSGFTVELEFEGKRA